MKLLKKVSAANVLTSLIVIFMLSWLTILTSCTATIRTPRHVSSTVVIEGQVSGEHNNSNDRHERRALRQERREHHE